MDLTLAYRGRSAIVSGPNGLAISLAPNLRRDRVSFEGVLRQPLRFREAIGALHDVVVSDLRYQPKDKSAYLAYLAENKKRDAGDPHGRRIEGPAGDPERDPASLPTSTSRRWRRSIASCDRSTGAPG